jgi:FtsP/CotA-like multicopper oxidase with cupredoxin domain
MKAGVNYLVYLTNTIPASASNPISTTTNVHTHGLHISGDGNGDHVARTLPAGSGTSQGLGFNWTIPSDHPSGTYWYHPHVHKSTNDQVGGGGYGVLVIEDLKEDGVTSPDIPASVLTSNFKLWSQTNEKVLLFSLGTVPFLNGADIRATATRQTVNILADQWYRFRVAVAVVLGRSSVLTVPATCVARKVAQDGMWSNSVPAEAASSFYFTGASRVDIAIRCPAGTNSFSWGEIASSTKYSFNVVATAGIPNAGHPFASDGVSTWSPIRAAHMADMRNAQVSSVHTVLGSTTSILWNNVAYSVETPAKAEAAVLNYGQVYEFRMEPNLNQLGANHPLHLHVFPMQIMGVWENGQIVAKDCRGDNAQFVYKLYEFYDTIKPSVAPANTCVVRIRTSDYSGKVMIHCHMLSHEDGGAMAYVTVNGGPAISTTNPIVGLIPIPAL